MLVDVLFFEVKFCKIRPPESWPQAQKIDFAPTPNFPIAFLLNILNPIPAGTVTKTSGLQKKSECYIPAIKPTTKSTLFLSQKSQSQWKQVNGSETPIFGNSDFLRQLLSLPPPATSRRSRPNCDLGEFFPGYFFPNVWTCLNLLIISLPFPRSAPLFLLLLLSSGKAGDRKGGIFQTCFNFLILYCNFCWIVRCWS